MHGVSTFVNKRMRQLGSELNSSAAFAEDFTPSCAIQTVCVVCTLALAACQRVMKKMPSKKCDLNLGMLQLL